MIQFNLLPDLKLQYMRAQRARRMTMSLSIIAIAISVGLTFTLFAFGQLQRKHINDLNSDIARQSQELKGTKDIDKLLTVQSQLNSLTTLHDQKPNAQRLFGYLTQLTPADASISNLGIDTTTSKLTINGTADSLRTVNRFVDTMKFTTYKVGSSESAPAFGNVVLSTYSLNSSATDTKKAASYTVDFNYDPVIFDSTKKVTLSVPSLITTRSQLKSPLPLFEAVAADASSTGTGN